MLKEMVGYMVYMQSGMRRRSVSKEGIMLKVRGDGPSGYMLQGMRLGSTSTNGILI